MTLHRKLFVIKVHSIVDVITNSSSTMFCLRSTSNDVQQLCESLQPGFTKQFGELQTGMQIWDHGLRHRLACVAFDIDPDDEEDLSFLSEQLGMTVEELVETTSWGYNEFTSDALDKIFELYDPNNEIYAVDAYDGYTNAALDSIGICYSY